MLIVVLVLVLVVSSSSSSNNDDDDDVFVVLLKLDNDPSAGSPTETLLRLLPGHHRPVIAQLHAAKHRLSL
ncbi:hypothetical protein ACO02O_00260 [Dirofilaria immitis]